MPMHTLKQICHGVPYSILYSCHIGNETATVPKMYFDHDAALPVSLFNRIYNASMPGNAILRCCTCTCVHMEVVACILVLC